MSVDSDSHQGSERMNSVLVYPVGAERVLGNGDRDEEGHYLPSVSFGSETSSMPGWHCQRTQCTHSHARGQNSDSVGSQG